MTMIQTFVINLDRAPERLALLAERLDAQGVTFERVPAVDARLLSDADISRHVDGVGYWGRLTPGEVACFLSHRACWRRIVDRGLPHGLVLEDDVVPGEAVGAVLADDGWIPADANLVKLETSRKSVWLASKDVARISQHRVTRLYSSHDCTAAYMVSRATAERLLRKTERFRDEVDELLFTERSALNREMTIYQLDPAPFVQEQMFRDITSVPYLATSIEGRRYKVRPRRSLLRKLLGMAGQGQRDGVQAVMEFLGRRRTTVVAFR